LCSIPPSEPCCRLQAAVTHLYRALAYAIPGVSVDKELLEFHVMAVFRRQQMADLIQPNFRTVTFHNRITVYTNRPLYMGTIKITPCILISFEDSLHR
jgi:hypothetical protein